VLHNSNFQGDNELMHTAIHEYAHHLQFTGSPVPVSHRAHTVRFWSLIHSLVHDAEAQGIYTSPFDAVEECAELTRRIKEKFLGVNGGLKELVRLLIQAHKLRAKRRAEKALRSGMSPDRVKEAPGAADRPAPAADREDRRALEGNGGVSTGPAPTRRRGPPRSRAALPEADEVPAITAG